MEVITLFKLLETFRVVYETRNFSKAGEILFISQPSVSSQIKQLEAELKTTLFLRNGRKEIVATPQADLLYQGTLDLLENWNGLLTELSSERDQTTVCRIAASHTFAVYVLPQLMKELVPKFPEVSFSLRMLNSMEVLDAISKHEADLGFIEKPLSTGNVQRFTLMEDQLVLAGKQDSTPWLVREPSSGVYYYTKRYLEENNLTPPLMEVHNNEVIRELLKQGVGRSILSKRAAEGIEYKELPEGYRRNFYLLQREGLDGEVLSRCITFILQWSRFS
ncbi:LysR family transcriptional regulator [Candidatus Enterococcus moelleringii]|uniref:LysR family transcriptional regulator n=1 Tax=Candidatus Enterococcus moelleringii TaxID=2815325 RepID=UPI001F5FF602|nr:LysR family transcriptional regulator [Enterococcus sp. 669A]